MFSALAKSFLKQNEEGVQRGGSCPAICLQQWDEGACWIPSVKCTVLKYSPPRSLLPGVEDVSTKRPQVDHCIQQVRVQHQPHDLLRRSSKEPRPAQHGRKPQSRSASVLVSQGLFFLMLMCLPVVSELERQSKRLVGRPKVGLTGGKSDIFSRWKTGIERWFWTRWFTLWGCPGKAWTPLKVPSLREEEHIGRRENLYSEPERKHWGVTLSSVSPDSADTSHTTWRVVKDWPQCLFFLTFHVAWVSANYLTPGLPPVKYKSKIKTSCYS